MMRRLLGLFLILLVPHVSFGQEPFVLKDGDRVVFLGNGVIEQEHAFGHLETRLTRRWPKANVTFRNMGWGGDTVQGLARTSGFQQPDGFARLLNEVKQMKPTVIFVGYGLNESFAGEKGLASFIRDYRKLLEQLDPLKARLVLLSPTWHEELGRPFPDPAEHNKSLETYSEAIYQIASERKIHYVNLNRWFREAKKHKGLAFTTNGIQLSDDGYSEFALAIEGLLDLTPPRVQVELDAEKVVQSSGASVQATRQGNGWTLKITEDVLRLPHDPPFQLKIQGLNPKTEYRVEVDNTNALLSREQHLPGYVFPKGRISFNELLLSPDREKLRQAIVKKGELFYRRWRPFNDHSRHWGFIGGDFKLYDDEIAALEKQIAELRVPRERVIEIRAAKGGER